jgi:hypothetical protein
LLIPATSNEKLFDAVNAQKRGKINEFSKLHKTSLMVGSLYHELKFYGRRNSM